MEQTLPPEQLKEEFVRRRKLQYMLIAAVVVLGMCVMFLGNNEAEVTVVTLVLLAGYTVFHIRTWRCPACDKFLGKNLNPSLCPKCGAQLK